MHGMQALTRSRPGVAAAVLVAAGGAATILGAYYFQYVMGLRPCPLCLEQRIAFYVSIPLAIVVAIGASRGARPPIAAAGLGGISLAKPFHSRLGLIHAGVAWATWPGAHGSARPLTELSARGE